MLVVGAVALAAALAVGLTSHQEGEYAALGAILVAMMAGAAVAVLGWAVLLALVVRRYVPRGRRFLAATASLGAVVVVAGLIFAAGRTGGSAGFGAIGWAGDAAFPAGAVAPPLMVSVFRRPAGAEVVPG